MENEIIQLLTSQGLGTAQFILTLIVLGFILFRRGEIKNLRKELLEEIDKLRTELLWKIDNLRAEQKADSKELRREVNELRRDMEANDTKLRKAVLLLANQSIDDPERLERIKDLLTL